MRQIANDTAPTANALQADSGPSSERIARRAYERCLERGTGGLDPVSDGLAAERELRGQMERPTRAARRVTPNRGGAR